jgi:4-hydroxythreonine-4-phosphate dehydrogenase
MKPVPSLVITTGDYDGIGLEIASKALRKIRARPFQAILLVSSRAPKAHRDKWTQPFKNNWVESFELASQMDRKLGRVLCVLSDEDPALWIERAARACLNGQCDAMVTGPLSKPGLIAAGLKDIGHTDILKRVCAEYRKPSSAFMGFVGTQFNVALATGHIPVDKVESQLRFEKLFELVQSLDAFMTSKNRKPIGILGLNPHAGDSGLIGDFEQNKLSPWIARLKELGFQIEGPLVPDVAFQASQRKKYSWFIALYHDQGLIPFKMAHGLQGAHFTLGLPVIRTSVDHGTAKDIFKKGIAGAESMTEALLLANKLVLRRFSNV